MSAQFGSTIWDFIRRARQGDKEALDQLFTKYRPPIVQFIQRSGLSPQDSEDLAQEVFVGILEHKVLEKADPEIGRFRSLLIKITKDEITRHFRRGSAKKRGGRDVTTVSIDQPIETRGAIPGGEAVFDQLWVMHLLQRAFKRLAGQSRAKKNRQYDIVRLSIFEGKSYAAISQELGLEPGSTRNLLHRGRQKLLDLVKDEVSVYTQPGSEYEDEVNHIMEIIGRGATALTE